MRVSVILVSYNSAGLLRQCLASIFEAARDTALEVIVVDNASSDGSAKMVRAEFPQAVLIEERSNVGFSTANNAGAHRAQGQYLFFLNADTLLRENSVGILADYLDRHSRAAAVGPRLCFENGDYQISAGALPNVVVEFGHKMKYAMARRRSARVARLLDSLSRKERRVGWLTGASLMVRAKAFRAVGGFDENIFMYYEDKDLCKRMGAAGWEIVYYPGTTVVHLLGGSSRSTAGGTVERVYRESQVYYYRKHLGRIQTRLLLFYLRLAGKI